ncbi:MAG: hypothetical protein CME55_00270 [Halieaceae bacterium]|nr:hypothetical protein [Halieaceae bacterium]
MSTFMNRLNVGNTPRTIKPLSEQLEALQWVHNSTCEKLKQSNDALAKALRDKTELMAINQAIGKELETKGTFLRAVSAKYNALKDDHAALRKDQYRLYALIVDQQQCMQQVIGMLSEQNAEDLQAKIEAFSNRLRAEDHKWARPMPLGPEPVCDEKGKWGWGFYHPDPDNSSQVQGKAPNDDPDELHIRW